MRNLLYLVGAAIGVATAVPSLAAADKKPNIVVIWGDDIGWSNISAYNLGLLGYRTPNIDRIAREGGLFTDWYGQQNCTAGRAAFLTGQSPIRTGLLKVGLPGAKDGLSAKDPTIAELLKAQGYRTAHYGKNHLGDLNEHLPSNHGFDEFFGNLYHMNAEEEPENGDYPKDPAFKQKYGPRGVIRSFADGRIEDTGPLTKKRMETIDEEFTAGALDFIKRSQQSGEPFFLWFNSTRMHLWTHLKPASADKTGLGVFADGMVEHDAMVGQILDQLRTLGLEDDTIVIYSTDNGAQVSSWPDGGNTPFRNEKNSNWEGSYRVPCLIRWPGVLKPGSVYNDIVSHEDLIPTLLAAAGEPAIKEKLLQGYRANDRNFKVRLDGYNLLPFFSGEVAESPRNEFFYWTDDGNLSGIRSGRWKVVFMEQRQVGINIWQEPLVPLRTPKLFCLRTDPYERADLESFNYAKWRIERYYLLVPARAAVAAHLSTFKDFPPRQRPASWSVDQILKKFQEVSVPEE